MFDIRLLFVASAWGINFSAVKYALGDFLPLSFTVIRFGIASLFLFAVLRYRGQAMRIEPRDRITVAGLGLLGITFYNIFFMLGLKYTTASRSALFISLSPLIGTLIETASRREPVRSQTMLGIALATSGVTLIIADHGTRGFDQEMLLGDALTLCAAFLWALYTGQARPLLERYPAMTVTAWSIGSGTLLLIPFSIGDLSSQTWTGLPPAAWGTMAFSSLIATGAAYTFWYDGVQRIGVTRTMAYHYLMPFVAVVFAALFLHENIGTGQIIGGIAILSGVALVQINKSDRA